MPARAVAVHPNAAHGPNPNPQDGHMLAIASLLLILVVSMLLTRMASLALTHTGLSRQSAAFQARSAFTGVGFTTAESEKVVNHPVRRRILLLLMLLGNAGVVTAIASLLIGFLDAREASSLWLRIGLLALGITGLMLLAGSRRVDRMLSRVVLWAFKRYTTLNVRDYAGLLHLSGEFAINELYVREDEWMSGRTLGQLRLSDEGVVVLAITRSDGTFLGAPGGTTRLNPNDTLVVYGRTTRIQNLDERTTGVGGELAHVEAVADQSEEVRREKAMDAMSTQKEKEKEEEESAQKQETTPQEESARDEAPTKPRHEDSAEGDGHAPTERGDGPDRN